MSSIYAYIHIYVVVWTSGNHAHMYVASVHYVYPGVFVSGFCSGVAALGGYLLNETGLS